MTKYWEWQVHCELCGFKRGWMKSHKLARARAFIHTIFQHPFGYVTISARETDRVKVRVRDETNNVKNPP